MTFATSKPLRVIALGQFSTDIPSLAPRLAALRVEPCRSATLEQLPASLDGRHVLLTELTWLNGLDLGQREDLGRRASMAAAWIAVTDAEARFEDQVVWQRTGVNHFSRKPLDADRLAALIEDIHDRLDGPPARVILLNGDQSSLPDCGDVLRYAGINTLVTRDPLMALESIEDFRPDLLLVDIEMPGCRGVELATIVRQRQEYASLPVIFLTAMEGMQDAPLARSAAAEDFLAKPVAPELLVATIKSHALRYRSMQRSEAFRCQEEARTRIRLEQQLAAVDEHAIVSITDIKGSIVHVNDRFCSISGYCRQELLGQNHRMIKSVTHPPEFYRELWGTISAGRTWHGEICNQRKNGELYWVEATIVPFLNDKGKPYQYISTRTDVTALKRSEEALRLSDELLRRAQVFANIGTWDWNIVTGELYWSERIAPLFGYPTGELETSYENFLRAVHPDDRQAVIEAVNASIERNVPYEIEHRVLWPDGVERWLLERGAVLRNAAGKAMHMMGVVQDIHERKQTELALAESEMRLRKAQALARIGDWRADQDSGELIWSEEIFRIFGRDPANFVPSVEAFRAAVHPDDRALVAESERRAAETGIHDVLHRIVRPDGSVRHVQELGRSEHNMMGKLVRLVGTVQDVTERVGAEAFLRETEERFAFAVEGAGDGIWDWNILTGEKLLSGNYEPMLGFGKGELEPTIDAWVKSVHPDDLSRVQQDLQDYLAGKAPGYGVELRLRCRDGSYKWVLCRGTVMARDEESRPVRMIGIHSDISERKAVEVALVEARKSAERANQAKSDFLSSMSHELRTPMNAILGFAQMLEYDNKLNADQRDNVEEILKGGRHLLELVNEVLDLAKIESGRINLSLESVDLASLVEDCWQLIQPLAAVRQITLRLETPPKTAVRADRVRLKQVLLNLLANAVKYNRERGDIHIHVQTAAGERLRIMVADTGAGIAPERMADLFQPFNRLDAEHGEIEGTGIGLTIARRLVEMMGGAVGVTSQIGVGTTFWIELPTEIGMTPDAAVQVVATALQLDPPMRQCRVLCIDDNPVNLKLIAQVLGMRPHIHLVTAHTPELGIELALAHRPELILLDINMPGMDGYQVLEVLKAYSGQKFIPVIAVTANAMPQDVERGRAAGFIEYLSKPIDVCQILKTIDRCLAGSTGSAT
jgi:PAS domain S-box-containing protein